MSNLIGNNSESARSRPWILRGKLRPPLSHLSLIDRSALVESLDELLGYKASVVVAPAGYGKTTLLTQWRSRLVNDDITVAWISLDGQDDDPYRFLCYGIFALANAGIEFGQLEMLAEQGLTELTIDSVLVSFLAAIEEDSSTTVLILDDYHRLESRTIDNLLDTVIESSPANFHLIISSRNRPGFSIAQLCATGLGIEVDAEKLRFSDQEMQQALETVADGSLLQRIKNSTEGWPVAVQLARLAFAAGRNVGVMPVSGRDGHIADFFSGQVVSDLPLETQEFLYRTSILDQFNPELASAVCGRDNAWRLLQELSDLSILIVSLDEEGDWYRYHHLFSEYLHNQLKQREPAKLPDYHLRASSWFEQDGDTQQAVRHAVQAGDLDRAARLIEAAGAWELILYGGIGYLRNLLRLIPEARLSAFPRLDVAKAYLLLKSGDVAGARAHYDRSRAQASSGRIAETDLIAFQRDVINIGTLLSVYEDDEQAAAHWQQLDWQKLPNGEVDHVSNGVLACQRATMEMYTGEFAGATNSLNRAMHSMRQANAVLGLNYSLVHAGLNNLHTCEFNQAIANAEESSAMAADNFGMDSGLKSLSDILLIALKFWRNETNAADWLRFSSASEHVARYDGWFEIYALCLETRVEYCLLQNDYESAADVISWAQRLGNDRAMHRLEQHAETMSLFVAIRNPTMRCNQALANRLKRRAPTGTWREHRFHWRGHLYASLALAEYYADTDASTSVAYYTDAIDCCRALGANFLLLRSLADYASFLHQNNRRAKALELIIETLALAEPQGLVTALVRVRSALPLLRYAQRHLRSEVADTATRRFVADAIAVMQNRRVSRTDPWSELLSPRESEILAELDLGHSNKQIANALDMTEHTVKFHLKNIFQKLSVGRRTEALVVARENGLI